MLTSKTVSMLATAVLLAGCTASPTGQADTGSGSGSGSGHEESAPQNVRQYVALGDSFTAAPYVPTTDLANGCLRSNGNYPSLVAERLGLDLTDVSCSSARVRDLRRPQKTYQDTAVPAQLDALTRQTDLVTIGIGGNDLNLFGNLLQTCMSLRGVDPQGAPCAEQLARQGVDPAAQTRRIGNRLRAAIGVVHRRSPAARVMLVGYPRISTVTTTCPRLLPLADGDYATVAQVGRSLRESMRTATTSNGAEFVDMYGPSRGHDVCSKRPWVNGRFTDQLAALAFHPFSRGMRAVAGRIVARLR